MTGVKDPARRTYTSAVREEGARRTSAAIVAAAGRLWSQRGYAATSLADIARAAGVARPTVTAAFGSKAGLLKEVLDRALAGDDEPVPVAQRAWFAPVWQAGTPAGVLGAYADVCLVIAGRAAVLFETVRRAADEGPELASLWQALEDSRLAGARMVVEQAARTGPLRPDLDTARAVDLVWLYNDPAHYAALVLRRGWEASAYRDWVAGSLRHALLAER